MTDYYKNKYRRSSVRLQGYDYSSEGMYFAIICTKDKQPFFGNIINGVMQLSSIGKFVAEEWQKSEQIRKNIKLGEWVIMPNHLHGIIFIGDYDVATHDHASLQITDYKNKFGPQKNNLSSIIRGFKSACTKRVHIIGYSDFAWQPRFYDHIIRNQKALINIEDYILENPQKWNEDKENPLNEL